MKNLKSYINIYLNKFTQKQTKKVINSTLNAIPQNATPEDLEILINKWIKKLKPQTAKNKCGYLATYIKWYSKHTKDYSFIELEFPKISIPAISKFVFSAEQIDTVKSFARVYDNSTGIASLIIFLCENGARIAEALQILSHPENFKENANKTHYVITPAFKNNNERAYIVREESWALYNSIASKAKNLYKNFNSIRRDFENFIKDLKEKYPEFAYEDITTHTFRRSYVTNQAEAGFSIVDIQKSTGHKDTNTLINTYILPSPEKMVHFVERASALDRLNQIGLNEMKQELNQLRDFQEKAIMNEKKYLAKLEVERLEKEEAILENKKLKKEIELLKKELSK
ncbi:tyrosine-type recombinase/integrase [Mycoplasma sp. 1932B]|uniref:tyrosine-type recombinase/integrase n=1 Tax=Mycoplasma sp. 1932B TaxID=3401670 RepID=UPI003AAF2740